MSYPRLLSDVGGTNVRFAMQMAPDAPLERQGRYVCAEFESFEAAARRHLEVEGLSARHAPRAAAIGIATAVTGDAVRMTNLPWAFSIRGLRESLQLERLVVINDFTALALALPALPAEAWRQVGGGQAVPGAAMALIGPGTGLGVSGLVPSLDG
ncbi:MAG TPA: glucokinase, partial [Burkholderiaceae bacterium]